MFVWDLLPTQPVDWWFFYYDCMVLEVDVDVSGTCLSMCVWDYYLASLLKG